MDRFDTVLTEYVILEEYLQYLRSKGSEPCSKDPELVVAGPTDREVVQPRRQSWGEEQSWKDVERPGLGPLHQRGPRGRQPRAQHSGH